VLRRAAAPLCQVEGRTGVDKLMAPTPTPGLSHPTSDDDSALWPNFTSLMPFRMGHVIFSRIRAPNECGGWPT
jgi:hypothetical protein